MKMKIVFCLALSILATRAHSQSAAWDPHVYLPQLGQPGFDTAHIAGYPLTVLSNIGPAPGGSYGRVLMTGIPSDPPFLSMIETGPNFDPNNLNVLQDLHFNFPGSIVRRAHLHTSTSNDLITQVDANDYRIYWQTESGSYSDTLFTDIFPPSYMRPQESDLYVTYLVSDTIEDIVTNCVSRQVTDTLFFTLYRGGATLFAQKGTAYPDSLLIIPPPEGRLPTRTFSQGDWRGVGRDDAIAIEISRNGQGVPSWFYFRNDPPFSLQKFADQVFYDTIFSPAQNNMQNLNEGDIKSLRALPKASWDKSEDLMPSFSLERDSNGSIFIFRGGPDFGTHRLFMDSADVVIPNPAALDHSFHDMSFWGSFSNLGDMTGTGRPVIFTGGSILEAGFNFAYVLGNAADGLADIYFSNTYRISGDSITADADNKEDVLIANQGYSHVAVLRGTSKIPIHINPRLAVSRSWIPPDSLEVYPNPIRDRASVIVGSEEPQRARLTIHNVLGQTVWSEAIELTAGQNAIELKLGSLPIGAYALTIEGERLRYSSNITILR